MRMLSRYGPIAAGLLATVALVASLYGNRERYHRADFQLYYAWWSEFRSGLNPYRLPRSVIASAIPGGTIAGFCNYTPAFVVLLSPLAALAQQPAYWTWLAVQLAALVLSLILLARELDPPPDGAAMLWIVALAFLFPHVHGTLHGAQPAFLLLLLLTASWILDRRSRPALAAR